MTRRLVGVAWGRMPDGTVYRRLTWYDGGVRHEVLAQRPGDARWRRWSQKQLAALARRQGE